MFFHERSGFLQEPAAIVGRDLLPRGKCAARGPHGFVGIRLAAGGKHRERFARRGVGGRQGLAAGRLAPWPPISIFAGLARNARAAGSNSESGYIVCQRLGLIEVRVAAALRRRPGKADALPHARVAEIERAHIGTQLAEEPGRLVAERGEQFTHLTGVQLAHVLAESLAREGAAPPAGPRRIRRPTDFAACARRCSARHGPGPRRRRAHRRE